MQVLTTHIHSKEQSPTTAGILKQPEKEEDPKSQTWQRDPKRQVLAHPTVFTADFERKSPR